MDQGRKAADDLESVGMSGTEIDQAVSAAYATWSTDSAHLPFPEEINHDSVSGVSHYHLVALVSN